MKLAVRPLLAFPLLALAGLGAATASIGSEAEVSESAFVAAANDLIERFGPTEERRAPPSASNPEVAADFATLDRTMAAFGTQAFPLRFPDTFQTVCGALSKLNDSYSLVGLPANAKSGVDAPQVALRDRNGVRYQDQVVPILAWSTKCMALHMPEFNTFWEQLEPYQRNETRKHGLMTMRSGVDAMVVGLVGTSIQTSVSPANRKIAIDAAAGHTANLISISPLAQRAAIARKITLTLPAAKKAWPRQHAQIMAALASKECNSLCQVR